MTDFNVGVSAQQLADSYAEPTITLPGGLVYRGRLLSIEEWLPFFERQIALEKAKAGPREFAALWVDYLRTVFPRGRFRFFAPDPVEAIRREPGRALQEAYERFFFHQARALGFPLEKATTPKTVPGTSSNAPTDGGMSVTDGEVEP